MDERLGTVLTVPEVADLFRVHPETIRRAIRAKRIEVVAGFRPFRVRRDEVARLLGGEARRHDR